MGRFHAAFSQLIVKRGNVMLKEKIGYRFRNESLFQKAMRRLQNNERLEFLGDSVLGFVSADYLYNHFPELPEGELTKLRAAVVCEQTLYEIAKELGIDEEIRLGHGEELGGGRQRLHKVGSYRH